MNRRLLALAATPLILAACNGTGATTASSAAGSGSASSAAATQKLTIGLSYVPDIQFAPFYVAKEKGYFTDAGLDVTIRHHGANEQLFGALQSGGEDVLYAGGDEAMQARSEGVKVVNVGTVYQRFPVVAITRADSGIATAKDLKGKTIGVPGQYGESWFGLLAILKNAGLTQKDVTIQTIGYTQQAALTTKKVDAVMGYSNNDVVRLQDAGVAVKTFPVDGAASLVSIGLNTTEANVTAKKAQLEGVVTALRKAVADIEADPAAAVTTSKKDVPTLTGPAQEKAALATLKATIPLFGGPQKVGTQDAATWTKMADFLPAAGLVKTAVPANEAYTTIAQ